MKQTLLIIFGGLSSEHEVSLHSAAALARAVDTGRYELVLVGITRMGQWLCYGGGIDGIERDCWHRHHSCVPALLSPSREDHGLWLMGEDGWKHIRLDLCLPVLHGRMGEDGTVQGLLELAGVPVVGCGSLAGALCMDKEVSHRLAEAAGIPCPRFTTVYREENAPEKARRAMTDIPFPWFVKPAAEGSSFGVTRVENEARLGLALENAFRYGGKVVVEEGIEGIELGCAVLEDAVGAAGQLPFTGAIDAIELAGGFFDFHEKYTLESARILLPAPISEAEAARVRETALSLYRLFGCKGFARVDLFYTKEGSIIFNEINTIPGMTSHSRFPGMLRAAGVSFEEMLARMLAAAAEAGCEKAGANSVSSGEAAV